MTTGVSVDGLDGLHSDIMRIWTRLLETSDLSLDDDFFDKGGDSLLATELMLELKKLTGIALPDSLLFESSTVRSLAQRLSEKEAPKRKVVVRIGPASEAAMPLVFFHGDWTRGGFYVEHLARKLGPKISLIAVAPHGPEGEPIPPSIEAMAADRLPEILAAQPTGPYRLGGHCVGGIVALETARLLMNMNREVETVVMIDSPLMVDGNVVLGPPKPAGWISDYPIEKTDDVPSRPAAPQDDWGFEPYTERLAAYSPAPISVRLLAIAGEFEGRIWTRLSHDSTLQETHTLHFELLTDRIDELAARMRCWLTGEKPSLPSARPPLGAGNDAPINVGLADREAPVPPKEASKRESLLRRLSGFFMASRK